MSDVVGASDSAMAKAVSDFNKNLSAFEQASQDINSSVNELASTWKGNGYTSFVAAMDKWRKDMTNVSQDLQHISEATNQSNTAFQDLDSQISKAFSGF